MNSNFIRTFVITMLLFCFTNPVNAQGHRIDTTILNKNRAFHVTTNQLDSDRVLLTSAYGPNLALNDTISNYFWDIEFPDFNKDGNIDIMLVYGGNNFSYFLYLFDPATNNFKSVDNFDHFPDAVQLKTNPGYYYSYHRAGCADMNWASDLFKIEKFKAIQLGHIDGQGCDFEVKENPQVIKIYKVPKNDEEKGKLLETLPYLKFIPDFGDKWNFIEKYWNRNYGKFE